MASYQVALVAVHARGVVAIVEVGLERVLGFGVVAWIRCTHGGVAFSGGGRHDGGVQWRWYGMKQSVSKRKTCEKVLQEKFDRARAAPRLPSLLSSMPRSKQQTSRSTIDQAMLNGRMASGVMLITMVYAVLP